VRVCVTGGREYGDRAHVYRILDAVHRKRPITLLLEGGACGADRLARDWAISRGVDFQTFEANWALYPGRAGNIRNSRMLREGRPALVVAFPGGSGTRDMTVKTVRAGIPMLPASKFQLPSSSLAV
jgi:hypothetical protein